MARHSSLHNALNRLNFIFGADSMAEPAWQERRQMRRSGGLALDPEDAAKRRGAVLAYRPSAKSAVHAAYGFATVGK